MGRRILDPEDIKMMWDYSKDIINKINNNQIDSLLNVDWELATTQFNTEDLATVIYSLENNNVKEYAIKACLHQYEGWLAENCRNDYNEHWNFDDPFQNYCNSLLKIVKEFDNFNIKNLKSRPTALQEMQNDLDTLKNVVINKMPVELSSPEAIEYLKRLDKYCDSNYKWIDKSQKVLMCQAAHIISGLLKIERVKWKPFEDLWEVSGLASAYNKRNGRPLDREIWSLFPEYTENI